ncbi:MAG: alanine racemase [Thermoanaerobaculia bacterium]|nr:alanine racemase [Thermoanaerobaculia bacterium]
MTDATTPDTSGLNSWIEISDSAYATNLDFFRGLVGDTVELSAVVKSNAYGHGLREIADLAIRHGADSFCVHGLEEALELREAGFEQDILVMGHVPLARVVAAVDHDLRVVLYSLESARRLAEVATEDRPARVHLKIETGTHRQGVDGDELGMILEYLKSASTVRVEGVYTHFANIEDTTDHRYARTQVARFRKALQQIEEAGFRPDKRHAACSAAVALFPETHLEMVRLGISQYGIWSSKETRVSFHNLHPIAGPETAAQADGPLRPVMTWKARISQVKWIPADAFVGYGCTHQTTRRTRLAVLPTGYADGYDRKLSNTGHVLVHGRRAPVLGRICMNLTMIDVTDIPDVRVEDEVVLLGRQGEKEITAEQMASVVGTIPYEIVARIAPHIPRIVVD